MANSKQANLKAPYPPTTWALGGAPVKKVDIPAQVVLMIFFLIGAAVHMKIFQKNRARGHKFLPSLFIFIFCISRILTSILRLASVSNPRNIRLAIAAQIFLAAGVVILFIINLIFTTRLVRSLHPSIGWHPVFAIAFRIICALIGITIIIVISATVQSFYTLDLATKATDRSLQLYGSTFLAIIAILPLPILLSSLLIPYSPPDQFGVGRLRTKVIVLLLSTIFLSFGAWYRCGSSFQTPVPRSQPLPSYLAKAPFYIFNFVVEIQTVLSYAILRVDLRFHVPNGAKGPGSYSLPKQDDTVELTDSRPNSASKPTEDAERVSIVESVAESVFDIEKADSIYLTPAPTSRSSTHSIASQSATRFSQLLGLTSKDPQQKRTWRDSEQERVIKRLGGPWEQLPSPAKSTFNSPTKSTFSTTSKSTFSGTTRSAFSRHTAAPSIPDIVIHDGEWTPSFSWDMPSSLSRFPSLRRFASMKRTVSVKRAPALKEEGEP
ncbi:hypothetical protein P153DRAFT_340461 [Dothidotthia symphoricarpi CBS 119687]|uniref:DUF7702 domain-containing protein n=1 Tax=Dothidotthia symphoricarpi CBS 119687 TaxID=1392245 RepID=A0A6A6AC95_9PLEO|nr:uncharacterized protein P153DRAFT_340461 [Dothidotthia symphoricarpi CBS 119687]KAF2129522.1 hypothetical protein P153DRAFT_340461 [Dothidotthia symphoricarpi CBS 119687]